MLKNQSVTSSKDAQLILSIFVHFVLQIKTRGLRQRGYSSMKLNFLFNHFLSTRCYYKLYQEFYDLQQQLLGGCHIQDKLLLNRPSLFVNINSV